ncbi:hypothetical protein ETD86_08510 [Nonomuraea turkmeniaca]|uniref:Uncharacterized protein n=1 Tax=Nonomuraea turkmeniaca TaxID=103838 RepID=A0A5S4FRR3_9ACTN|nr:hypothetical protein [Nonomuraea turkmeniaca]TMR23329.1 hypothetical protein ETD86_08510 [Nonomuraea turkmeniaca]
MTGDVLSPRWSTDDTDEQPAIQVVGNETYIMPSDSLTGEPVLLGDGRRDLLDDAPAASQDLMGGGPRDLGGLSGPHDVLGDPLGPRDVLGEPAGSRDVLGDHAGPHDMLGGHSGPHDVLGDRDPGDPHDPYESEHSGPHRVEDSVPYLPLDRSYEAGYDDGEEERPKRGFLGSGWTDDSSDGRSGGDREVRRRTRKLLVAAAAVVLVGVGAGFMLTGTSSDDPCQGGRCASAGEVTAPSDAAVPEDTPTEEDTPEPDDSATAEPTDTESVNPPRSTQRPRPTREPAVRPTSTRVGEPTTKSSDNATRPPVNPMQDTNPNTDTGTGTGGTGSNGQSSSDSKQQPTQPPSSQPAQQPTTQAPAPTPTKEERKGLLDILFPW